jgi:putative endonuclease
MRDYEYFVYILSNRSRTIYIGVTHNLIIRLRQHREGQSDGFTKKYRIHRLVYYERFRYINKAIDREKQLKHNTRAEKISLIETRNPTWDDLSAEYFLPFPQSLL